MVGNQQCNRCTEAGLERHCEGTTPCPAEFWDRSLDQEVGPFT